MGRLPRSLAASSGKLEGGATAYARAGSSQGLRAYLSNVCVAKSTRRRGVAQKLMQVAEDEARVEGVSHLYVHVVSVGTAAEGKYAAWAAFHVLAIPMLGRPMRPRAHSPTRLAPMRPA